MDSVLTIGEFGVIKSEQDSLVFVDKLWESLRESMWEKQWKGFHRMEFWAVLHILRTGFAHLVRICGKISRWFCTRFDICKMGGFTHFPQSLLLQLLNIL